MGLAGGRSGHILEGGEEGRALATWGLVIGLTSEVAVFPWESRVAVGDPSLSRSFPSGAGGSSLPLSSQAWGSAASPLLISLKGL